MGILSYSYNAAKKALRGKNVTPGQAIKKTQVGTKLAFKRKQQDDFVKFRDNLHKSAKFDTATKNKLKKEAIKFKLFIENKINGKVLGPVSAPIVRLKRKYRMRLLIRGSKTLKLQNTLAIIIPKYKFLSGIKLSVDVDPISFN